jgi:threonine aldolase
MARRLADQLNDIGAITVDADLVETNMVFMTVPEGAADPLRAHLASRGILLGGGARVIRLVTHLDVDVKAADQFAAELADFFQ